MSQADGLLPFQRRAIQIERVDRNYLNAASHRLKRRQEFRCVPDDYKGRVLCADILPCRRAG